MLGADDRRRRADDAREASLKSVVEHLANVTERSQHIVRDEIELAKAEVAQKVGSIGRGVAVGGAAGIFVALGGLFFLHGLSFFFAWAIFGNDKIFLGYFLTTLILFVLAGVGGFLAWKFVKKGAPPVPTMAIDEAKLIRESVQGAAASKPLEPQHGPSRTLGTPAARRSEEPKPAPARTEASTSAIQKPVATVLPTSAEEPEAEKPDAPDPKAPSSDAPDPKAPSSDAPDPKAEKPDGADTPKGGSDES